MILNWEKFQAAYAAASSETKTIIDSEQIPVCAEKMCLQYDIPLNLKKTLTVAMVNKILGLDDDSIYIKTLSEQGVPQIKAEEVIIALENCLLGKPTSNITGPIVETKHHSTSSPKLDKVRTMEEDSKQIGYGDPAGELTYTTMQSALLQESARKDPLK